MKKYISTMYDLHYKYVYALVYKRIGNADDAEDICQEVFANFFTNFDKIHKGSEKAWLITDARLKLLNYYKKANKAVIDNIEDHEYHPNMFFFNGARDVRIILKDALEAGENFISDEEKIIFEMIAIFKYTQKEVGKQLNLSRKQVEYRYEQVTKRLIDYLSKKGFKSEDIHE